MPLAMSWLVLIPIAWAALLALIVGALAILGTRGWHRRHDWPVEGYDRRIGRDRRGETDRRRGPADRRVGLPDLRADQPERRRGSADRRSDRDRRRGQDRRRPVGASG